MVEFERELLRLLGDEHREARHPDHSDRGLRTRGSRPSRNLRRPSVLPSDRAQRDRNTALRCSSPPKPAVQTPANARGTLVGVCTPNTRSATDPAARYARGNASSSTGGDYVDARRLALWEGSTSERFSEGQIQADATGWMQLSDAAGSTLVEGDCASALASAWPAATNLALECSGLTMNLRAGWFEIRRDPGTPRLPAYFEAECQLEQEAQRSATMCPLRRSVVEQADRWAIRLQRPAGAGRRRRER